MPGTIIDTLVFDLFGVLIAFDNDRVYARLAAHCQRPAEALPRLNGLMARTDIITGKLSMPVIHRELVESHGFTLDFGAFERAWLEPYHWPMEGMRELLGGLSARYQLGLLPNIDGYYWPIVRASQPELERFDALLLSCELGLAKPDPEVFHRVCRRMNTAPERCYFIDDTRANVDAASAMGFHTHCFRGVESFERALREKGLI